MATRGKSGAAKSAPAEEDANPAARFGRVRNTLKMGLVGLPNVGKSSLFNLLTAQSVPAENFPFCTIDPSEARAAVPDSRFDKLCEVWSPPSRVPAYLSVTDIAGLIRGASEGQGLGNAFLSHIQAVDGVYHLVRAFDNDEVLHVDDSVDAVRDLETIHSELCLKDLDYVVKAIEAEEAKNKRVQGKVSKESAFLLETLAKVRAMLEDQKPIRTGEWSNNEVALIKDTMHQLITTKPIVYLVNLSKADFIRKRNKWLPKVHRWVQEHGGGALIPFSVEFEEELFELREDEAARAAFLEESKCDSAMDKIISTGYRELNLIHFLTAGEKEVRCWTVQKGALAPQAAGVIHTDFERGFIKAEVVQWADYEELSTGRPGMAEVKAAGKYRQEGKQYKVTDGDIIEFKFNVTAQKKK